MIKHYFHIAKPGITAANMIAIAGGFFLASRGHVDIPLLLSTIMGISLVVASGCVLNNYVDRDVDRLMSRTRSRALAKGLMSPRAAVVYAAVLGTGGLAVLAATANILCAAIVAVGFVIYVVVYSLYMKRSSVHAPLIGSLAGAAPPVAGYCAVSNHFDAGAVILLSIFILWQMPHFYAIAIYRLDDYAAAVIPVHPLKRGVPATKRHIMGYIPAFIMAALMLTISGYTGYRYLCVALALGLVWLAMARMASKGSDDRSWARRLFVCSIVTIVILNIMMSMDYAAPSHTDIPAIVASYAGMP